VTSAGSAGEPGEGPGEEPGDDLARLGWDARWQAARAAADPALTWQPARVAAEHRGAYQALGAGGVAWIELPGRAFHAAADKRDLPTVGDWVLAERWPDAVAGAGAGVIRAVLPRRSLLVRRAAGEATAPQPLAANVDTGIIVTSANADLSPARIDRYVSLLRDSAIAAVVALSKIDLVADPAPLLARLGAVAPRVVAVSIVTGAGIAELRALGGSGATAILVGSSGVGKSSLLNAIAGTAQPTRPIRGDDRGRHTTTRRELFVASGGGLWIDTPGMRELAAWLDQPGEVPRFDDIAALAGNCRFRDCGHVDEPGCAVRGAVAPERLASFHKLAGERRTSANRQSTADKIADSRRAKLARAPKKPPRPDD